MYLAHHEPESLNSIIGIVITVMLLLPMICLEFMWWCQQTLPLDVKSAQHAVISSALTLCMASTSSTQQVTRYD